MPHKDKDKRNAYMRDYMRRQRSAEAGGEPLAQDRWRTFSMEGAEDLRRIVSAAMELLENADVDPVVKARAIFQGAQVGIKLLELTSLAKRLEALEGKDKAEDV